MYEILHKNTSSGLWSQWTRTEADVRWGQHSGTFAQPLILCLTTEKTGRTCRRCPPPPTPSPRISSETARAITGCSPLPYPKLPVKVSLSPQPPVSRKHPSAMSLAKTSETSHRNEQFHALYKQNLGRSGLHTRPPPGELTKEPHPVQLLNGLSHPS